jgi:hypothetical protein
MREVRWALGKIVGPLLVINGIFEKFGFMSLCGLVSLLS